MTRRLFSLLVGTTILALASAAPADFSVRLETRSEIKSRVANVHVEFERDVEGAISIAYGSCSSKNLRDTHHTIVASESKESHRLVWIVPEQANSGGCLTAFSQDGTVIGRSEPQTLHHDWRRRLKRDVTESIEMTNETGIDTVGAWMEGVKLLENKQPAPIHVEEAKAKEIAIVGAGMAGLMTWLILEQAGLTNVTIVEGSNRLGGRIRTEYLSGGPFDYSYQEMGPMRLPYQYTDAATNTTHDFADQALVYQLADEVNKLNRNSSEYLIEFIRWVQSNLSSFTYVDGFRLPSGLPPTSAQIAANASLGPPPNEVPESAEELRALINDALPGEDFSELLVQNLFKAHAEFLENGLDGMGGDVWSEFAFMVNYLGGSLNDTAALGGISSHGTYWNGLFNSLYFGGGSWRTVDGGMSRLSEAFGPLVNGSVEFGRRVERVQYQNERVELQWRESFTTPELGSETYDYAIISAPFSVVRGWRMPSLDATISTAIAQMPYQAACKVALEFSERFWELYESPIYGGCGTTTDIPGIGTVCYPSYNMNSTGPATVMASYTSGPLSNEWLARSKEEHVQYVLDAMVEIHGPDTRGLYTGKYSRKCWTEDPFAVGAWASPTVGMHQLFIPEYFKTHKNMIFIGEHTSISHAWISSALESGLRGGVQMLLELGLVDEAKDAVDKWAARWIDI